MASFATTYGVTSSGFKAPLIPDIQNDLNATIISLFGASTDLSADAPFGQLSGILAEREYNIWAAMQDTYISQYLNTASGASLDNVGTIVGIPRLSALESTISNVNLWGSAGTVVPSGTGFQVSGSPTSVFATNQDVTLIAGTNCVQTITFSLVPDAGTWSITANGQTTTNLAYNASASSVQAALQLLLFCEGCTVTGDYTSGFTITFNGAGTGGLQSQNVFVVFEPTLTSSSVVVTVTPTITTPGVDQALVSCTATSTGPTVANIDSLTVIANPVSGLTTVANVNAAVVGRNVETDTAYRQRINSELAISGAGTFDSLVSKLKSVTGVTGVVPFANDTDTTDGNGLPPHSFEMFVQGGSSADIGNTIWATKPVGIQSVGTVPVSVLDVLGGTHTVYYSRPNVLDIYIIITLTVDGSYPANGNALVADALTSYGNALGIGKSVIVVPGLISSISSIAGIDDAVILIGTSPSPTLSNNITVTPSQIAVFDPTRITVIS